MQKISNYIDGKLQQAKSGEVMDNYEPAVGQVYSQIPVSSSEDIQLAVTAAANACTNWSGLSPSKRSRWLWTLAEAIERDAEALALAESIDTGKPVSLTRELDIPRAAANLKFFATAIMHNSSQVHHTDQGTFNYTNRSPVGVAGCISPWNLPLYLLTWKIAPALATGNCVVAKPSEVTPMTAYLLSKMCQDLGLPKGVLNIVHGPGNLTGRALVAHPGVQAITFTGGTATGKEIASVAAPMLKKLSLELGGKNPNIIFDDCDYQKALEVTLKSSFMNQGQVCLCGSRVFVQSGVYQKFRDDLIKRTGELTLGDPLQEDTKLGSLVSAAHLTKVKSYVELARNEGGTILTGGEQVIMDGRCKNGYFMRPTIIEGLDNSCRTNQEEIFGPVITLMPFKDEEEVIRKANDVEYGLSATLWTQNLNRAHRMARSLKSGVVWINCWLVRDLRTPFGGMKQSGVGREGGEEALRFFTEPQNVCLQM